MAKARYLAIDTIVGKDTIPAGERFNMDTKAAAGLLACGAIRPLTDAELQAEDDTAKQKAEADAKAKAEAEAQAKAAAEAKIKVEAEAKFRAEAEAKAKAEAEAKAREEQAARERAEAEERARQGGLNLDGGAGSAISENVDTVAGAAAATDGTGNTSAE